MLPAVLCFTMSGAEAALRCVGSPATVAADCCAVDPIVMTGLTLREDDEAVIGNT
jgi:hypothetical protein